MEFLTAGECQGIDRVEDMTEMTEVTTKRQDFYNRKDRFGSRSASSDREHKNKDSHKRSK